MSKLLFFNMKKYANNCPLRVSFAASEKKGEALVKSPYVDNYEKLVVLKTKYDPTNLFRLNQNIKPTV